MTAISLQARVMIQELAKEGLTNLAIGQRMHLSLYTVRKWRRRGRQAEDISLLVSRMGRPSKGALSTFSAQVVATLEQWRGQHPGWGPKTLVAELKRSEGFLRQSLPSIGTLSRWLKQTGRSKSYHKHSQLPAQPLSLASTCHEEWEMDARGHEKIADAGVIALINVNDVYSKVKIISYPCWLGSKRANHHPTTLDYQTTLRLAFTQWGMPDRLAVDHDSVYFDNTSQSPFPTRFHLWLIALGIFLSFGRMGQPKDQAMTERSHQTWYHQVLEGQTFSNYQTLFLALQDRLTFLNQQLPCASLGEQPPLVAHPEASRPHRPYRPENEAELLDLSRVHAFLAQGKWFRKASNIGAVSLGSQVYCLGPAWPRSQVVITFDPDERMLVFRSDAGLEVHKPLQGLSCQDLMGDNAQVTALPFFQLALPFNWQDRLEFFWARVSTGTTL